MATEKRDNSTSKLPLWRRVLAFVRMEEALIGGLLIVFAILFVVYEGTPSLESLWSAFAYNFYGGGAIGSGFVLWCAIGTGFLLLVAMLPLASHGRGAKLMQGVWAGADGFWPRARATVAWGVGGLRAWAPFLACMGAYEILKRLIPAVRGDTLYDQFFADIEYAMFGDLTAAMMHKFMHQEWITEFIGWFNLTQMDIHEACYISYVYTAPALAMALWFLGKKAGFNQFVGALSLCAVLAYVGYVLVPVVGPKYVFEDRWLEASSSALAFMDDIKARNRDCFPSLHTAWTTLVFIGAWKYVRPLFWVYLPIGIGVYIATLYGGYHYIPDIIAGHVVAIFGWWAARPLRRRWNRLTGRNDPVDSDQDSQILSFKSG